MDQNLIIKIKSNKDSIIEAPLYLGQITVHFTHQAPEDSNCKDYYDSRVQV